MPLARTLTTVSLSLCLVGCAEPEDPSVTDEELHAAIEEAGVSTPEQPTAPDSALVELGEALFFDPLLSGNQDIACSTCHSPVLSSSDGLSMAIGTGGRGLGPNRIIGERRRLFPRNTPELFNRGAEGWTAMYWDGQVSIATSGDLVEPHDMEYPFPDDVSSLLAAASMLPVVDRDMMLGRPGDDTVMGTPNEVVTSDEDDFPEIWRRLMDRLLAHEEYRSLFAAAFPEAEVDELGFGAAARALAAYQATAFRSVDTPFDRFLQGDTESLDAAALRGAKLFFVTYECSSCHSGPLLSDQRFHNLAVPQVGLGFEAEEPFDFGRGRETEDASDHFRFRTPPLRNVELTGPWMHDGAYTDLRAAVAHHFDPEESLRSYDPSQLKPELQGTLHATPIALARILATFEPELWPRSSPSPEELDDLLAFLRSLTDPSAIDMRGLTPETVPSGLAPGGR